MGGTPIHTLHLVRLSATRAFRARVAVFLPDTHPRYARAIMGETILRPFHQFSPQAVFVLVAGLFATTCALVTPPGQVPDEPNHWYRVYQLTQGDLLAPDFGGKIPASLIDTSATFAPFQTHPAEKTSPKTILREFQRPLHAEDTRFVRFPNTSLYSPLPYLPQTLAMLIARMLNLPPIALLYASRLGTVLGYLLIGGLAIRITPILKWPAVMLLTCPMSLFLAGSLSADPITTATVFLATAVVLRCIFNSGELSAKTICGLAGVMIAVTLCKSAYFPVALLVLAIPREKWGSGNRRWILPAGIILLSLALFAGMSAVSGAAHVKEFGDDPGQQLRWILHHPAKYAGILGYSVAGQVNVLIFSGIGSLGWLDTPMNPLVIKFYLLCLIWITLAHDEKLNLPAWPRIVAAVALIASAIVVITANYLVWNRIGQQWIRGLQGRYFLPIALLFCMTIRRRGLRTIQPVWMLLLLCSFSLYTIWVLFQRYYGITVLPT